MKRRRTLPVARSQRFSPAAAIHGSAAAAVVDVAATAPAPFDTRETASAIIAARLFCKSALLDAN